MNNDNVVLCMLIWFSVVVVAVILIFVLIVLGKHRLRKVCDRRRWKKCCKNSGVSSGMYFAFALLLDRRHSYFLNYFLFLVVDKGFGILSVGFSIIGIIATVGDTPLVIELLVAFLALIFVVLALYVSPSNRVTMYLSKWQECDSEVNYWLGNIECLKHMDCENQKKIIDGIVDFVKECEVALTNADT